MELREFVQKYEGLHIHSRTTEEIQEDNIIEALCMASLARSLERRGPRLVKWGLAVQVAETELSAHGIRARRFTLEHIQEILMTQRPKNELRTAY